MVSNQIRYGRELLNLIHNLHSGGGGKIRHFPIIHEKYSVAMHYLRSKCKATEHVTGTI